MSDAMQDVSDDAHTINRLNREVDYYKRAVTQGTKETFVLREELTAAIRETQRNRVMLKLVREVYRLGDFGGADANVEPVVLSVIIENAICDRAMLLAVTPDDNGHHFRVLCTLGGDEARHTGKEIVIKRPHRYCYTTGNERREGQVAQLCALVGLPYILWSYDPGGGFAILLGNHKESNASHPFNEKDQELVETALSVYLDILHRKRETRRLESGLMSAEREPQTAETEHRQQVSEFGGIQQAEIQEQINKGERLTGFLVVDRTAGNGPVFVGYVRGSWSVGYRLLKTFRGRSVRAFRDVSRLLHIVKYDFRYSPPITIYAAGTPELRRFPGVWPTDIDPYGRRDPGESETIARCNDP